MVAEMRSFRKTLDVALVAAGVILLRQLVVLLHQSKDTSLRPVEQLWAQQLSSSTASSSSSTPSPSSLAPFWQCTNGRSRDQKLAFVHVFKTAGSTFRALLGAYARTCRRGLLIVGDCSRYNPLRSNSTLQTGFGNDKARSCTSRTSSSRSNPQQALFAPGQAMDASVAASEVDLWVGHLPLGMCNDCRYITFVREPRHKFVSAFLYIHRAQAYTEAQAIAALQERIRAQAAKGAHYDGYGNYFLTPAQKARLAEERVSRPDQVQLMLDNLQNLPVLVGVVERMPASVALVRHWIDPMHQLKALFATVDGTNQALVVNRSKLSTSRIVNALERDAEMASMLREHLKYDQQIYEFAVDVHERQYQALLRQQEQ